MDANPRSYDWNKKPVESVNNAEDGGAVIDGSTTGNVDVNVQNAHKACPMVFHYQIG